MVSPTMLTGLGAAAAVFFSSAGSVFASVHGGIFALYSPFGFVGFCPIIIGGVLSIYGLVVAILLAGKFADDTASLTEMNGYRNFSAGLAVGFACLCSGVGLGKFLQASMNSPSSSPRSDNTDGSEQPLLGEGAARVPKFFFPKSITRILLVLVFIEAIGLYGLIVALFLIGKDGAPKKE